MQVRHQLPRLLLRGPRQHRVAVEVHEQDAAAAPHHPPRRDRRVDAPGQQAHHPSTRADRKPAGTAILAEEIEGFVGQRLDVNRQLGMRQVHRPVPRFLDPAADLTLDLGRRQRKALVGPARRQPERRRRRVAEIVEDCRGNRLDLERRPAGLREIADAEHSRQPIAHHAPVGRRAQDDLDTSHEHAHRLHVEVRQRRAQVAHQPRHEPRAVLSFKSDFLVVDDD